MLYLINFNVKNKNICIPSVDGKCYHPASCFCHCTSLCNCLESPWDYFFLDTGLSFTNMSDEIQEVLFLYANLKALFLCTLIYLIECLHVFVLNRSSEASASQILWCISHYKYKESINYKKNNNNNNLFCFMHQAKLTFTKVKFCNNRQSPSVILKNNMDVNLSNYSLQKQEN